MENRLIVSILKLRKTIFDFYQKHDRLAGILVKGIASFLLFFSINSIFGRSGGSMFLLAGILAVICSVLPLRKIYLATAVLTSLQLWQVSWDVMLFYLAVVILSWLLVCRIKPDTSIIIAMAPLLFYCKVPFLLPLLVGNFSSLFGVAAMVFGIAFYYLCIYSLDVTALLTSATSSESVIAVKMIMDHYVNDADLLLLAGAFIVAAVITYILYHQAFDHAWYIGIAAGGLCGIIVYLVGGILFDIENGNMIYIFTIPVAIILAYAVQFFRCVIDYTGAEKLEFEDDDYYYYVKAVPKVNVIVDDFAVMQPVKERPMKNEELEEEE